MGRAYPVYDLFFGLCFDLLSAGHIPPELGNLSALKVLSFSRNKLNGESSICILVSFRRPWKKLP